MKDDITLKNKVVNATQKKTILWTVDCTADGKYCAIGGSDALLRIYHALSFQLLKTYTFTTAVQCLDWNKNGKLLAIALDDNPIQLLHPETGIFYILLKASGSRALSWNSNGAMLATGDKDGLLYIWNKKGKLLRFGRAETYKNRYYCLGRKKNAILDL